MLPNQGHWFSPSFWFTDLTHPEELDAENENGWEVGKQRFKIKETFKKILWRTVSHVQIQVKYFYLLAFLPSSQFAGGVYLLFLSFGRRGWGLIRTLPNSWVCIQWLWLLYQQARRDLFLSVFLLCMRWWSVQFVFPPWFTIILKIGTRGTLSTHEYWFWSKLDFSLLNIN